MKESSALFGLLAVSFLWGCNYVSSAYLLHYFSPIFLSTSRILITSIFLIIVAGKNGGLKLPTLREWKLLLAAGISGTLCNQVFYFTGLHHSTAGNAALIIALSPIFTAILSRVFLKELFTQQKVLGSLLGLLGVIIIVWFGGKKFGVSMGDFYLFLAMLALSVSLLFIRKLTTTMSSYAITIYATVFGSILMIPAAIIEGIQGNLVMSDSLWNWIILAAAGIIAQGMAGFWWNRGISSLGAGTAAMFMNIPPFIALILAHFVLGDSIQTSQLIGGFLVLSGVAIANKQPRKKMLSPQSTQAS